MRDENSLVCVFVARSLTEADIIRGLLQANDIDAYIADEDATTMLDGVIHENRGIAVNVALHDLDDARSAIEEAHTPGFPAEDEEE